MEYEAKVMQVGNSLYTIIPAHIVKLKKIKKGDVVKIKIKK